MTKKTIQLAYRPVGRRRSLTAAAVAVVLTVALTPLCDAQAAIEGAQIGANISGQAPPPPVTPPTGAPPAAAAPAPNTPLLRTPPPSAGPIQASVTSGVAMPGAFSAVSHLPQENNVMHIMVGHQVFIDTKSRLRRVFVADPTVLNSQTLTPNQIVVTAMAPGISSLTLLDEIGRAQSYMISSDLDIAGLRATMEDALAGRHITVEGSGGRVVLTGAVATQTDADEAVKLAGMYSKDVVNALVVSENHPKQVRLEVRILEVDRAKAIQYGVNLFNPGGNTNWFGATTTTQYPSTLTAAQSATGAIQVLASNPLNFFLYSARANLGATIQDLQTKQVLQILAEPTITTISGVKADFLSGGEFPFPMVEPGSNGAAPIVTLQFRPFGVKVEFTPVVNADGTIRLTVAPEVSALDYSNAVSISGFTVPAISTRRASTQVELRSDQPFAISGLLDQRTQDLLDKNPGISSIPILGDLFKSKNQNHSTTELVIIVTPSVVDPLTDAEQPAQPGMPIPTLDRPGFDQSLGKDRNPRPAPPPLDPNRPPYGDAVPTPLVPDPNSPDGRIAGDATLQGPSAPGTPAPAAMTTGEAANPQTPASAAPVTPSAQVAPAVTPAPAANLRAPTPQAAAPAKVQPPPTASPAVTTPAPASAPKQTDVSGSPAVASNDGLERSMQEAREVQSASAAAKPTVVEIMALSHESDADATLTALRRHGYNPTVNHSTEDSLLHVDLGPFPTKTQAETVRQRLIRDGYDATLR